MKLNEAAKTALRDAGVSQAAWARANWSADGTWGGDACGCPDDRCTGFHHAGHEECGCLRVLLDEYLAGEGTFAEFPPDAMLRRAVKLLERALFLRMNGERPPGAPAGDPGAETWRRWDSDAERLLRSLPPRACWPWPSSARCGCGGAPRERIGP